MARPVDGMNKKRVRVRDGSRAPAPENAGSSIPAPPREGSDGFTLAFSGGRGILSANDVALSEALVVSRLDLFIFGLSFPFDISAGVRGLRHRRHVLGRLTVSVPLSGVEDLVARRLRGSSWCDIPTIAFERDYAAVLVRYGPEGSRVPLSFRLVPVLKDGHVRFLIDEPRAFGPLPASLPLVAAAAVEEMTGIRPDGLELVFAEPLKRILFSIMPARGWRLPDYGEVPLRTFDFLPDRLVIEWKHPDMGDGAMETPLRGDEATGLERLRKAEEQRVVRPGDVLLASGQVAEARSFYSKLLARDPGSPFTIARLAMVDVIDPRLREAALALVAEALARSGPRTDLLAVAAQGAALAGDARAEEEALAKLATAGSSLERLAAGERRGSLLIGSDPKRAAEVLEQALSARRDDRRVMASLIDAYAAAGDAKQLKRFAPRWIAAHLTPAERAAAHVRVGAALLRRLGEPAEAAWHFERAALADPESEAAAWGLAESLAASVERQRAIVQFERLERICRERGDAEGSARALAAIGSIWLEHGDLPLAAQRLREALERNPAASPRRVVLARCLARMGHAAEAADELEVALKGSYPSRGEPWWGEAALALADLYLEQLDDFAAAEPWARALAEQARWRDQGIARLRAALSKQGDFATLSAELERDLAADPTPERYLDLARVRRESGDPAGALAVVSRAATSYPERPDLLDALIDLARDSGDHARLGDALSRRVESVAAPGRRAELAVELAELELEQGTDPAAAIYWFRLALAADEQSARARAGLARAFDVLAAKADGLRDAGEHEAARLLYATARTEGEGRTRHVAALGEAEASLAVGDFSAALIAAVVAGDGPEELRPRAALTAARALAGLGRFEEAVRSLEKMADTLPDDAAVALVIAAIRIGPTLFADVERMRFILERVLSRNPGRKDVDEAIVRLLETTGDGVDMAEYLARERGAEIPAPRLRRAAEMFLAAGMEERAAEVMKRLYEQTWDMADAYQLARVLKALGQVGLMIELLGERAESSPDLGDLLQQELGAYVEALEAEGRLAEAADAASKLARFGDADGERSARAARLAQATGDNDRAREFFRDAVKRRSKPSWVVQLIRLLDPRADRAELRELVAVVAGHEDLLETPERIMLLEAEADLALAEGDESRAVDLLFELLDLAPSNRRIWERTRALLERRGNWNALVEKMKRRLARLEQDDEIADAAIELGRVFEEKTGDEVAAQEAYDKALERVPDHQEALRARAALAYQRHSWERLDQLTRRIVARENDHELSLWRAASAEHMGRRDEAFVLYHSAASINPTDPRAADGLARLGESVDFEGKLSEAFERLHRK